MVVDDVWVTIGTANFDTRSFAHNEESNVCVYDPPLARELTQVFDEDATRWTRIEYDTWRRRGWFWRLQEVVPAFLTEQM